MGSRGAAGRAADALVALVPGGLVVFFAFHGGGYFPAPVALAAAALTLALVVRFVLADEPLAGASVALLAGSAALALLAVWQLLSSNWSHAPARALTEYDRTFLYLLALVVFGLAGRSTRALRRMLRGLAAAIVVVCACALITRTLPDVWHVAVNIENDRLSYPLTYWNALGLLAALGTIFCFALTSDHGEPPVARVLAASALPVLGATLLFTFSRGAMAAGAIGLVTWVVVARPRLLLSGLIVGGPALAIAIHAAYGADLLASQNPTSGAAADQGHDVMAVVIAVAAGAAVVRSVLLAFDRRLAAVRLPPALARRSVRLGLCAGGAVILLVGAVALGAPRTLDRQYDRFVGGNELPATGDLRTRLTEPGNNGRIVQWRVALDGYRAAHLHGEGAGTYALLWDRGRPVRYQVEDAHSLYVEALGELGIVGAVLVVGLVLLLLGALLARARGPDRATYGALFAAGLAWALHAGVDWDWEMPVVTVWLFPVAGMALARSRRAPSPPLSLPRLGRILAALAVLIAALSPVRLLLSDDPLRDGVRAFGRGECAPAIDRALDSIDALSVRPEPYVVLGYCDIRIGQPALAVQAFQRAVARDRGNWEYRYGLAVARAVAGQDPRPDARAARALNPLDRTAENLVQRFKTGSTATWRRRALQARLPE